MSRRVRIILALHQGYPDIARSAIGEALELASWIPAGDNNDCWICRAREDEIDHLEHQVCKIIEFAGFTAGIQGRLSFALKVADGDPRTCAVRIGSGGVKTQPIQPRFRGAEFATTNVPGGSTSMPGETSCPGVTRLKTAF